MALTDTKIKAAKPSDKIYKLYDANGLYLKSLRLGKSAGGLNIALATEKSVSAWGLTRTCH